MTDTVQASLEKTRDAGATHSISRGAREMKGRTVAIDFETFYDSKAHYSLRNMDPYAYTHDPRFDAYLVSAVSDLGEEFVGRPEDLCWGTLDGALLVAHNASFDGLVLNRLIELGKVPDFRRKWVDTADMAAYLGRPRNLKDAAKALLGIEMSKAVRAAMDGRSLSQALMAGDGAALLDYAADDARNCLRIWKGFNAHFPQIEREISEANREAGWHGIAIDKDAVKAGLSVLRKVRDGAADKLPWVSCEDEKSRRPAGSLPAMALYARSLGMEVPGSFKKDDPAMMAWVEKHADDHPFIRARLDHASSVPHIARLESMLSLVGDGDILRFNLKYFGAHTGRSSSEGESSTKFNPLNLPRDPKKTFGVDMRGMLVPRKGHVFMVYDYSQVEPRITHWLARNTDFLSLAQHEDIYQAAAKVMGWYPMDKFNLKQDDPACRQLSKACTIGLGYSLGAAKFLLTCEKQGTKLPVIPKDRWELGRREKFILRNQAGIDFKDPANESKVSALLGADSIVKLWRSKNKPVVELWKSMQDALESSALQRKPWHDFELPSGRIKRYFYPHVQATPKAVIDPETGEEDTRFERRLFASTIEGKPASALHGGVITENLVQSIARDIMFWGMADIRRQTPWSYLFNCYDEVVFEVPEAEAGEAAKTIPELLCRGSAAAWTKGLPLAVEGRAYDRYSK